MFGDLIFSLADLLNSFIQSPDMTFNCLWIQFAFRFVSIKLAEIEAVHRDQMIEELMRKMTSKSVRP